MDYGSHILRQLHLRLQSYHLGGMGCANGCVAINLLRDLLQVGSSTRTQTEAAAAYPSPPHFQPYSKPLPCLPGCAVARVHTCLVL